MIFFNFYNFFLEKIRNFVNNIFKKKINLLIFNKNWKKIISDSNFEYF